MGDLAGAAVAAVAMGAVVEGCFDLLTQDLVCNILARLPPASLAIARCVCGGWNQIVCGQPPSTQPTPWCFLLTGLMLYEVPEIYGTMCVMSPYAYTACTCWVYSPQDTKWFQLPAPDVPNLGFFNRYVTASQGLVVFQPRGEDHVVTDFWVGNPLSNKWRIIPFAVAEREEVEEDEGEEDQEDDRYKHQVARLVLDADSKGYKLVVFLVNRVLQIRSEENVGWTTHVYDSSSRTWKAGARISDRSPIITASCSLEGVVYVLQWHDVAQTKLQVLAYHIDRDEFSLAVPAATVCYPNPALKLDAVLHMTLKKDPYEVDVVVFEILGALRVAHETGDLENFCVFKYNATEALWVGDEKRESRIRDFYFESLLGSDIYMHCCGQAGTAYLSPHYSKQSGGLIAYDSAKGQGTCLVHPGVYAKLLVREFMERNTSTTLTSSIGSFIPRLDVEP